MAGPQSKPAGRTVLWGAGLAAGALLAGFLLSQALAARFRTELVDTKRADGRIVVRLFAEAVAAPLDFDDHEGIAAKLEGLRATPQVEYAGVWRAEEAAPVATLGRTALPLRALAPDSQLRADTLELVEPVIDPTGRTLGKVVVGFTLRTELARYEATRRRLELLGGALLLAVSAAAVALARAQRRRRSLAAPDLPLPRMASAAADGVVPGTVLGEYQLLTLLGTGGMGRVWAARQVGALLHRLVAIKTTLGGEDAGPDFDRLFLDEARIASQIRHPNVCGVYELGQHQGVLYQVMEWCDGASLRELLDRLPDRRMPPALAARLLAKVAAGLHAAHELEDDDGGRMNVVHRDVSPQNILISRSGQCKLTDFGVAKAYGQLHRPTETGEIKGKIAYMAPEQVTSMEVDRRTDVFALGCVLYEATTGRPPFRGDGALSTLYQLLSQDAESPCVREPSYPPELAQVVLKALQRAPEDRYQTAEQLAVALEAWLFDSVTVVTEQAVAELLAASCGALIEDRARRIEQAVAELTPSPSEEPPLSDAPERRPEVTLTGQQLSAAARALPASLSGDAVLREAVARESLEEARPTIPAAPAARRAD